MKLEIAATQLSLGLQGDDVASLHQALLALGRDVPLAESDRRVVGPGTVAVVKAVQEDFGLPGTGIVDAKTVEAINASLAASQTTQRAVRGRVSTPDGTPAHDLAVLLYLQGPAGEKVIGKSSLDTGGAYVIACWADPTVARIDLRIEVSNGKTLVATTPSSSSVLTNAGMLEVVDFVLTGVTRTPSPEFTRILADIKPLIGLRNPAVLKEVSLLGCKAAAHRHKNQRAGFELFCIG